MTDPCPACAAHARNPTHGGYCMDCLHCCARLLATTIPQSPQAAAMLAVIERGIKRWSPGFGLDDVKASARQIRAKRRSTSPRSDSPFGAG